MRNILEKLSKEKLIDFIMEYLESDAKFANTVNVCFGEPEFGKELSKIENAIDNALGGATGYRNRGGWGYIDVDTDNIFAETGYKAEAADMINGFKLKYKRKPAFVDELNKIKI